MKPTLTPALATLFASTALIAATNPPEAAEGYRCAIESVRNTSMGTELPIEPAQRFFPMATLTADGDTLTLHEAVSGEHSEGFVDHVIDPATGRYSATTMLTDHAIGEQHVIVAEGACERATKGAPA